MTFANGWKEKAPIDHPSDLGTPKNEWKTTKKPQYPREELKRWVRGNRYIRLCKTSQDDHEYPYIILIGLTNDEDRDRTISRHSTLEDAEIKASLLSRLGGY